MPNNDSSVGERIVEVAVSSTKRCVLWIAKFWGIVIAGGLALRTVQFIGSFFPSLSFLFLLLQLLIAVVTFAALDAIIPLWFKERIPVIRIGASRRAETYAKWYAWYSLK